MSQFKVPFFDYPRHYLDDKENILRIVDDVGSRGAFIMQSDLDNFEAGHRRAGGIGAVRRVGDDDAGALGFAAVPEILLNATDGGEFTLRTRHGLQGHLIHARTHRKHVLHFVEDREQALQVVLGLVRMNVANPRHLGDDFVDARVVLHGAGSKRVEARVDAEILA